MNYFQSQLEDYRKYLTRLNVTLRPAQEKVTYELLRCPETSDLTWCRGSGKSFCLGLLGAFWAYHDGWTVIVTAPKQGQTWSIMEWVHYAIDKLLKPRQLSYDNRYEIAIRGRGKIIGLSGDEYANTQGKHGHVVLVDEKQDMNIDTVTESFVPMLANFDGILIMSGVGGDPSCVGEVLGKAAKFRHVYPYQEHLAYDPNYSKIVEYERSVMLPQEFAAHFECKPLDVSERLLIPHISSYTDGRDFKGRDIETVIGIDWGKFDKTIATVLNKQGDGYYISDWFISQGNYQMQLDHLIPWLRDEVEYDYIVSEANGVGDVPSDLLMAELNNVSAVRVTTPWKTKRARDLVHLASHDKLLYNGKHKHAAMFHKDITNIEYSMTNLNEIHFGEKGHSDFLSSLMLCLETARGVYI
jgi:hypothetical protein